MKRELDQDGRERNAIIANQRTKTLGNVYHVEGAQTKQKKNSKRTCWVERRERELKLGDHKKKKKPRG